MDTYINLLNELDKGDPILTIDKSSCYNILVVEETIRSRSKMCASDIHNVRAPCKKKHASFQTCSSPLGYISLFGAVL